MTRDRAPDRGSERSGSSEPGAVGEPSSAHPRSSVPTWRPRPEASLPTVEVWDCEPTSPALSLAIRIDHHAPPAPSPDVRREWATMQANNPRLYDGPVLSVVWFDHEQASMLCRADTYQRLAVQPRVQTGVRQLGVTALLIARETGGRGATGREHVLLGRRGPNTRIYGGMWELGPSGGLDSWHPGQLTIDPAAIIDQAADEVREEAGIDIEGGALIGLVRDDHAFSYDVIVRFDAGDVARIRDNTTADGWEYTEIAWVAVDELAAFARGREGEIIGPARSVMRAMGWTTGRG